MIRRPPRITRHAPLFPYPTRFRTTTKGNIVAPVRSSSALVLSSTNLNRERIYIQQPPISAIGFSSQAFAPHFPHTVRKTETKTCSDCHLRDRKSTRLNSSH